MEGIISHAAASGLPGLQFPQQVPGIPIMGFPPGMHLCGPSALNTYSAAAEAANLLHPLDSFPASLQAQQLLLLQQQPALLCEPTQYMKLLSEDSPKQQHAHSDDPSDDVAAAPAAAAAPLPLPARLLGTNAGHASHTSSSTGMNGNDRTARESDGHQSAPPPAEPAVVAAAPAATPASSDNKDSSSPAAAAAAGDDTAAAAAATASLDPTTAAVPNAAAAAAAAAAPEGLRVDLASPVGPRVLQGTLLSPGANIEELEGCCQALMMLGAMQQQANQKAKEPAAAAAAGHVKPHSKSQHPQHQQLQRVAGRAARSSSSGGRGAAAAAAGDRDSAGSVHTAAGADHRQKRGSEQGQAAAAAAAAAAAGADSEAVSGGSEQGLGRGKRQRKPQRWNEQMEMLDQIVSRELGSGAAAEGADDVEYAVAAAALAAVAHSGEGCGSGAASEGEQQGHRRKRRQQSNLAVAGAAAPAAEEGSDAAAPAGEQQQQQHIAGGSSRRRRGSFEGEDWAAEDDVSYDAAADLAGAESADYEIEEEMDVDDEEYDVTTGKRGGSRGSGGNSRLRRAAALQRAHGSSRKSRRANAPMYESEAAVPANAGSASFLGVSKKRSGKWQAAVRFGHDGAYAFWCCYGCPRVAARARDAAALALRGPGSARLNFPEESYSGDEIMAAAECILAKHPQLALDHPLVMGMSAAEVAAAAAAGGNELAAVLGGEGDEGVGEQGDAEAAAADRASPAAAPAPRHQRNTRSKRNRRGAAAAAAAEEAAAVDEAQQQQQQDVDAAMFSRCFDLAALVLFGAGAVTESAVESFSEEELTAAATAMSCRLPTGTEGRQQLLAMLGGAAGMLQAAGDEVAAAAAAGVEQQVKEGAGSDMQQ